MKDDMLISRTALEGRAYRCLARMGLTTVGEVQRTPDHALLRERSLGKKTLRQIREVLGEFVHSEPLPVNIAGGSGPEVDSELSSKLRSIGAQLIEMAELMQSRQQGGA